jgi:hypothetical protein
MPEGEPMMRHTTAAALRALKFDPGSVGPKVEVACRFAERTGRIATIDAINEAERSHCSARRDSARNAFVARECAGGIERRLITDGDDFVDHTAVDRNETGAGPLDLAL